MIRLLLLGLAASVAFIGAAGAQPAQTGPNPELPPRAETLVPRMKIGEPAGWNGEMPTVPAGYTITPLATDLQVPRQMLLLPNGDILVAEGKGGYAPKLRPKDVIAGYIKSMGTTSVKGGNRITLLRDADNDGVAELKTEFITGLNAPYGLAMVGNEIFVANQDSLMRFPYQEGQTEITVPGEEVTELPSRINHHWTKSLAASADGSKLYVGIGSNSNVGERGMDVEEDRAVVWEIDRVSGAHRIMATGIRNPTALAIEPGTGTLWAVVNERDELGPDLVPDYLTSVQDGAFYGWPYSYWGKTVDPRVQPPRPDLVEQAIAPDYALGSHVAALGLSFATGAGMGGDFTEGAFVGEHGSWNRQDLAGYKVTFVPFTGGRPNGEPRDFVTGFLGANDTVRGRPVGVLFDERRSSVLVADDLSNTVWKVTRNGPVSAAVE